MTLRQLRAFVEIIRHKGFSAASRHLDLTQSGLSHLIRDLEDQLGLRLIDRTTKRVSATAAGNELLPNAERILYEVEQAVSSLRGLVDKRRGRVTVAAPPMLAAVLLPGVIAQLRFLYPAISVRLIEGLTAEILKSVRSGEADMAVGTFKNREPDIVLQMIYEDRLVAIVPARSAIARKRRLVWKDLGEVPLIMPTIHTPFHYLIYLAASQAGVTVSPAYEVGYIGTAIGLVEAGLGVAVLPAYVRPQVNTRKANVRPLAGPVVTREISLATREGRSLSPAAQQFAAVLCGVMSASHESRSKARFR